MEVPDATCYPGHNCPQNSSGLFAGGCVSPPQSPPYAFFSQSPLMPRADPFDTGFTALQTLFGTVAKVASLIAIVIGGYGFAHGEPGAKKALAGVAAGTGMAVLAVNVLSWLWGVLISLSSLLCIFR